MSGKPTQFHYHSNYLASKYGFFCVGVDYRLSEEAPFPAALQDAKCAIRWVRAQAEELNIDPDRVAVAGGSAGGHLTSMVSTTAGVAEYEGDSGSAGFPSHANLAVCFNGEFDMWDLVEKGEPDRRDERLPRRHARRSARGLRRPVVRQARDAGDAPDVAPCTAPRTSASRTSSPWPYHKRLIECGVDAEIEIYEGKPHAWFNQEPHRTETLRRMEQFLVKHFRLSAA